MYIDKKVQLDYCVCCCPVSVGSTRRLILHTSLPDTLPKRHTMWASPLICHPLASLDSIQHSSDICYMVDLFFQSSAAAQFPLTEELLVNVHFVDVSVTEITFTLFKLLRD